MGYVGLPLAQVLSGAGFPVLGLDIDPAKVEMVESGQSYVGHISSRVIQEMLETKRFSASSDFARIAETDVIILCVPTPLTRYREPDLAFIEQTAKAIRDYLRRGQLVVLESTTYPGTTAEVLRPILEESGLRSGTDFFLAYSPGREDPGNPQHETADIPKVVGGAAWMARTGSPRSFEASNSKTEKS